jgi:hypothetical protein
METTNTRLQTKQLLPSLLYHHTHSLANTPKYQTLRILAMSIELLVLLYFSYGMQLMGDDTPCPTSHNSWLEYGPRLGPLSSVRLHPDMTSALRLLPSLPLRDDVLLSIVLSPVHFLNPIASTAVRWSFGIESWMTHDMGLIDASDAIIWRSAWAAGYMLEGARLTACRIGTWTGPSPRTVRAAVLPPVLSAQPPSSPTPPSPQQLNVKSVPYFQSVRGRALVARSKRKPAALPRVPYAEYIAAVRRAHAQQRIESDEVTLLHRLSWSRASTYWSSPLRRRCATRQGPTHS